MRVNNFIPRCFTILTLLFLFSCQKSFDIVDSLRENKSEELSIENAQQWFVEKHTSANSRQSSENAKTPNWNRALYLDFEFGEAVVTPLIYQQNYSVSFIKNKNTSKQSPKATMSLNSLNYLLVYKDKDNKYVEEIVSIIPEEEYVFQSNYMKKNVSFSGIIQVKDWEGNIAKGYIYDNNKLIGKITDTKNARLLLDCYETSYYSCPSENLSSSGEVMNYQGCNFLYSSTSCFASSGSSDGNGYSSIVGFNAAESPVEKARKLAAKVPQAYKQNLQCVPFANALKKTMQMNNISGKLLEVRTTVPNQNIMSDLYQSGNVPIATNGYHQAIQVGDTVFDNLNSGGVDYNSWRGALAAPSTLVVTSSDF
ncbi:papain fold toxin domain-containing protein [Spirosoma sp. KCTC 42546]|uniref:papain fold toxin domain-containing protein n=1 Tax=Spirosoma sp. KCTC 42546 TaxID=2520506 RepID=UPI00143D3CBA|nr:papain fold toxin domain-containing protein [Spirosoma sp. KCTC 42546]